MDNNEFSPASVLVTAKSIPKLFIILKNIKDSEIKKIETNCSGLEEDAYLKCKYENWLTIEQTLWGHVTAFRSQCNNERNTKRCFDKIKDIEEKLRNNIERLQYEISVL